MDRRDFLKWQMQGALWLAAGATGLNAIGGASQALAAAEPDISVVRGAPGAATRAAVEMLGGMKRFVKPGQKVVIKPNMSFDTPAEAGSNTHPLVLRELMLMCQEAGASRVLILDNPLRGAEACLRGSGIPEPCNAVMANSVQMVQNESMFSPTAIRGAAQMASTQVMKAVLESDVLIAAPAAKSHGATGVSLAIKGQMGLILEREIMHSRYNLDTSIVDLASLLKADLTVVDAIYVLSTGGPYGPGKVLKEDTIIASADMVAADAQTVSMFEWYGRRFQPRQVPHIKLAHERGLGRMDVENMTVKTVRL